MANDFISVRVDFEIVGFDLQSFMYELENEEFKIISSIDSTQRGSIKFEICEDLKPRIKAPKRPALKLPHSEKQKITKTVRPNSKPTPALNSNGDDAILRSASSKLDASNLVSVVQNLRTNEKEYRCSFCQYVSKDSRNARRHVELKHVYSGLVFQCKTCGKTATLKANLKAHYMKAHNMSSEAANSLL